MKRKIILAMCLVAMLFAFSLSVSAITLQEAVDKYEGYFDGKAVESIDAISAAEHINPEIYEGYANTAVNARVELSCTCGKTHIYPTYYITRFYAEGASVTDQGRTFYGNKVFHVDFADINAKNPCGATYDKNTVVAIEIPDGYAIIDGGHESSGQTYLCGLRASTSLKYVDMTTSTTLVELDATSYHEAFGDSPALEYVKLADGITSISGWAFENCPNLKRVVVSENSQIKSINTRSFVGCTSLEAFYLPEGFERLSGQNKSDYGAFTGCTAMYFVNDSDSLEKPDVYYFPQSLTSIEYEAIKNCPNMNSVLVFGEKLTKIDTQWSFATNKNSYRNETNPLTLVFKGNMTKFSYSGEQAYTTVVFANPNQGAITFNPTGDTGTVSNSGFYICANATYAQIKKTVEFSETGFKHVAEAENTGVHYENYFENGYNTHKCFCGAEFNEDEAALAPVFESKGYSVFEVSGSYSMTQGFAVNFDMLKLLGEQVDYGVLACVNSSEDACAPELNGAIFASLKEYACNMFEIKVINIPSDKLDTNIIFCAYVKVGEKIYYLDNDTTSEALTGISYKELNPNAE